MFFPYPLYKTHCATWESGRLDPPTQANPPASTASNHRGCPRSRRLRDTVGIPVVGRADTRICAARHARLWLHREAPATAAGGPQGFAGATRTSRGRFVLLARPANRGAEI